MTTIAGIIGGLLLAALLALVPFFLLVFLGEFLLGLCPFGLAGRFVLIMIKSLRRNLMRTSLTYLATFVLVFVDTMIWSVLHYLDTLSAMKSSNVKVVV